MGLGRGSEGILWSWSKGIRPMRLLNSIWDGLKEELGRPCLNHPGGKIRDKKPRFPMDEQRLLLHHKALLEPPQQVQHRSVGALFQLFPSVG